MRRFVERFQLWHREKLAERTGSNPLSPVAFVTVLALAHDAYTLITSHQLAWPVATAVPLLVGFLILYACKSPLAWWIIPIMGASCLIQIPFIYASWSPRARSGIWLLVLIGVGFIAYGFIVRKRYYAYLEAERLSRY